MTFITPRLSAFCNSWLDEMASGTSVYKKKIVKFVEISAFSPEAIKKTS